VTHEDGGLGEVAQAGRGAAVGVLHARHEEEVVAEAVQGHAGDEHPLGVPGLGEDGVTERPAGHADQQGALGGQVVEGERQEQQEDDLRVLPDWS